MTTIYHPTVQYRNEECTGTYYREEDNREWHVHQSYETKENTKTVVCKNCANKEFMVGAGSYFTAIKCIICQWEECIHDG